MPKYICEEIDSFQSGGETVRVIRVTNTAEPRYRDWPAQVWLRGTRGKCCACEGERVGMRADCRHVKAVQRWLKQQEPSDG